VIRYLMNGGLSVDEVVLLMMSDENVKYAAKVVRLALKLCVGSGVSVKELMFNEDDLYDEGDVRRFRELVSNVLEGCGEGGCIVDVTGGRKSMSIIAALEAMARGYGVVMAYIKKGAMEEVNMRLSQLRRYDIGKVLMDVEEGRDVGLIGEVKELICGDIVRPPDDVTVLWLGARPT